MIKSQTSKMSQQVNLEELESWTTQEWQINVDDVLPKLSSMLQDSNSSDTKLSIVKILSSYLLPWISPHEAEFKIYSVIMPEIKTLADDIVSTVQTIISSQTDVEISFLCSQIQGLNRLMNNIEECLVHALSEQNRSRVTPEYTNSLPATAIHVALCTFSLCKACSSNCADILHLIQDTLAALFNKTSAVINSLCSLLDLMVIRTSDEFDVNYLLTVCDGVAELGSASFQLDAKIMSALWKIYARLAVEYHTSVANRLDVCKAIILLCNDITAGLQILCTSNSGQMSCEDEKLANRNIRVCSFNLRILVTLCEHYRGYLGDCQQQLYRILIFLTSVCPPCSSCSGFPSNLADLTERLIGSGIEPLISHTLADSTFVTTVLEHADISSEDSFPRLILLVSIMDQIFKKPADVQVLWMEDRDDTSLLQQVFDLIPKCYLELNLPVQCLDNSVPGKTPGMISLYEFVYIHICTFIAGVNSQQFKITERVLVSSLLDSCHYKSLLAADCWAFMARFEPASLCCQHFLLLMTTLIQTPSLQRIHQGSVFINLTARLFNFLPTNKQTEVMETFPLDKHPTLWRRILHHVTADSVAALKINQTYSSVIKPWIDNKTNSPVDFHKMLDLLDLHSVLPFCSDDLVRTISALWQATTGSSINLLSSLLAVTSSAVSKLTVQQLHTVLSCVFEHLSHSSENTQLMVIGLLEACGTKFLPTANEKPQVIQLLCKLFANLQGSDHLLIRHHAMQAFSNFARVTPHEDVIRGCLEVQPQLRQTVCDFLNSVPAAPKDVMTTQEWYTAQKIWLLNSGKPVLKVGRNIDKTSTLDQIIDTNSPHPSPRRDVCEPTPSSGVKRPRSYSPTDQLKECKPSEVSTILETINNQIDQLVAVSTTLTDTDRSTISKLIDRLLNLQDSK